MQRHAWCVVRFLRRHLADFQVVLGWHAESVGHAIEKGKHRDHIDRFRNLIFTPTGISQFLHIGWRGALRPVRDDLRVVEQGSLRRRQTSFI